MRIKKLNINPLHLLIFRAILILALLVVVVGCSTSRSSPLVIKEASMFDDPSAPQMIISQSNKVTSGRWGAKAMMTVSPFIEKSKVGGNVSLIGLIAAVEVNTIIDKLVMQSYSPINSLIFLADGDRIELQTDKYNDQRVLRELNKAINGDLYSFSDTGIFSLSKIQYEKIMSAKMLEFKVVGGTMDQEFYRDDIRPEFQGFLKDFYTNHIDKQ